MLENALQRLSYDSREAAFARCDDILAEFCTWPFGQSTSNVAGPVAIGGGSRRREGGSNGVGRESVQELVREVRKEMIAGSSGGAGSGGGQEEQEELCLEVVATVLEIYGRMDSLVSSDCTGATLMFSFDVLVLFVFSLHSTRSDAYMSLSYNVNESII